MLSYNNHKSLVFTTGLHFYQTPNKGRESGLQVRGLHARAFHLVYFLHRSPVRGASLAHLMEEETKAPVGSGTG